MKYFLLWQPGWWILHVVTIITVLYMGHLMH
jgi:hypothetical protein